MASHPNCLINRLISFKTTFGEWDFSNARLRNTPSKTLSFNGMESSVDILSSILFKFIDLEFLKIKFWLKEVNV